MVAVVLPEIVMDQGQLIATWHDARLFAAAAGCVPTCWRRGILGTIVSGMAVLLPLRWAWAGSPARSLESAPDPVPGRLP